MLGFMSWIVSLPDSDAEVLTPGPQSVTLFEDRVFIEIIKVKRGDVGGA